MKSYRTFACKELLAERVVSVLILFAIILSAMMTAVIGQSTGILSAMRIRQAIAIGGDRYATFIQMDQEQRDALQNDPRLSYVGEFISLGAAELNASLTLGLNEYQEDVAVIYPAQFKLKEGRLPDAPMEIALSEDVLRYLHFTGHLGDGISLELSKALRHGIETSSYEFTGDFVLVGILENNYLNYIGGLVNGIVGQGTAKMLLPENYIYYNVDIRTADKKSFQNTMDSLISSLQVHELDTIYNAVYLDALGIPYEAGSGGMDVSAEGFSFLTAAGILIGALFLLAAGLVIYNILKIAVSRRISRYGILRAIGAEKGQLYFLVTAQILLLSGLGIPIGLLCGVLSAKGILTAATGLLSPEIFLVQDGVELNRLIAENSSRKGGFLLLSAVITLFFALAAGLPAARYAAEVSPTVAMAGTKVTIKRKNRKTRKIRNFERYYAWLNMKRNKGRSALTILSLVMSIAVFITLQGNVSLLNGARDMTEHMGDYSIINEMTGFSDEELKALERDEGVASVAAFQLTKYDNGGSNNNKPIGIDLGFDLQPGETFQVLGMNDAFMEAGIADCLLEEELEQLKAGEGCVIRNPVPFIFEGQEIPRTEIHVGEVVSVAGKELAVLHTLDGYDRYFSVGNNGFTNGVQVIVNSELYSVLTGKEEYHEFLPTLKEKADREQFDTVIEALAKRIPGTTWISYEDADRQLMESFEQIRLLAWGLILFVGLIGLLNIINTVYTNIHTRVTEIGIQRAIGMSMGSLYQVFLWEGAYYGMIAAIVGSIVGYICLFFTEAGTSGSMGLIAVPVVPMAEAALLSVGACLLASCIPLRRIGRMKM